MELHRQRCQACGSVDVRNIIRRGEAHPATVYVRCAQCGALVARYRLSAYYHHGKGFESWLRSARPGARESGRSLREEFESIREDAEEEYAEVLEQLAREGKDV